MKTRAYFLGLLILTGAISPARSEGPADSVVKIYATLRGPDMLRPWAKLSPREATGSGVVIEGKQVLTNAHVVQYASDIFVQGKDGGDKFEAKIKSIAPGIDLAVLTVDNPDFFAKRPPLRRKKELPLERTAVEVYGYPIGGRGQSVTKGIVSRVDFTSYSNQTLGLRVQIDAAINPGNSGGPALAGDQMIGLAFSRLQTAQNIGYIIPNEEIENFLRDPAPQPWVHGQFQNLQNDGLRKRLGFDDKMQGILVSRTSGPLQKFDVVTQLGPHAVDNEGMVQVGENWRFSFQYVVPKLAREGKVAATIRRGGKLLSLDLPVTRGDDYLIPNSKADYPDFFLYGPLVFSPATISTISSFAALPSYNFTNPVVLRRDDKIRFAGEQLVVVACPMLRHKCVRGYQDPEGYVVEEINNVKIKNVRHLIEVLRDCKEEFVTIGFAGERTEIFALKTKDMADVTREVMEDNGITRRGSRDLVELWNQEKKQK